MRQGQNNFFRTPVIYKNQMANQNNSKYSKLTSKYIKKPWYKAEKIRWNIWNIWLNFILFKRKLHHHSINLILFGSMIYRDILFFWEDTLSRKQNSDINTSRVVSSSSALKEGEDHASWTGLIIARVKIGETHARGNHGTRVIATDISMGLDCYQGNRAVLWIFTYIYNRESR